MKMNLMRPWRWLAVGGVALTLAVAALAQSQLSGAGSNSSAQQAQTSQPEPQDQTMPSTGDKSSGQAALQEQGFAGKIMKSKDGMVLKDSTNRTIYKLDDAEKARQFLGKNVTVTGTLDQATRTIHVSNIEPSPTF
jgi:hypothetical protein